MKILKTIAALSAILLAVLIAPLWGQISAPYGTQYPQTGISDPDGVSNSSGGVSQAFPGPTPGPTGAGVGGQINVSDVNGGVFINALKALSGSGQCCSGGNTPASFDSNGYPATTLSANYGFSILTSAQSTFTGASVQWEFLWPASCVLKFTVNQAVNFVSSTGSPTVSGGTNSNMTVTTPSNAGSVIFTFPSTQTTVSFLFTTGFAHSCPSGGLALVRVSDVAAYNAGQYFTPEFLADEQGLHSNIIRTMGWSQINSSSESVWAYRTTPATLGWNPNFHKFPPNAYGGSISDVADAYTIAASAGSPADWTDGEVIQGQIGTSNTTTTPTLTITGHTGAKTIVDLSGNTLAIGALSATGGQSSTGYYTFIYNKVLDKVLESPAGITNNVPVEVEVSLANQIKANLASNFPVSAQDSYVTSKASYICSNLNASLYYEPIYSNEIWNFSGQTQTSLANNMGLALSFPNSNGEPYHGWYGLRVRQIMGNLVPSVCSGHLVRRIMEFQEFGSTTNAKTYRFQGTDLNPTNNSALCTYLGGTFSGTCSGAPNYSAQVSGGGNGWPIDVVEVVSYAPYTGGVNLCTGNDLGCTPTADNVAYYNALLNAYENVSTAAAIALVDSDIRNGQTLAQTVTCNGTTTLTTPLAHGFATGAGATNISFVVTGGTSCSGLVSGAMYQVSTTPLSTTFTMKAFVNGVVSGADVNPGSAGTGTVTVGAVGVANNTSRTRDMLFTANVMFPLWEAVFASYDAGRPAGMAALRAELYEGALEPKGPSAAQCTSLSIADANCATNIDAAITAWKNDPTSAATTLVWANQFLGKDATTVPTFGLMAHSKVPSQLQLTGPSVWSLLPGDPGSTPYQTYTGWSQVQHN